MENVAELNEEPTLERAIPNPEVAAYYLDNLGEFTRAYPHLDLREATERLESLAFKAKSPPRAGRRLGMGEALESILAAKDAAEDEGGEPAWTWSLDDDERAEAERRLRARELGIPQGEGWNTMSERRVREWMELLEGGED